MVEQYFTVLPKMKNPLDYIHKYPERTRKILGISAEQFEALLKQAESEAEKLGVAELIYDISIAKRCLGRSRETTAIEFVEIYRD